MYHIQELLGKVVTLKTATGQEFVGRLIGKNEDNTIITVNKPKIIAVNVENGEQVVYMMPFYLTATAEDEHFFLHQFLSVRETMESTAQEYLDLVQEEEPVKSVEVEIEPTDEQADRSVDAETVEG